MAVDAYMCFIPTASEEGGVDVIGETIDEIGAQNGSFEIADFKWGASAVAKTSREPDPPPKPQQQNTGSKPLPTPPIKQGGGGGGMVNLAARSISVDTFSVTIPFDTAPLGLFRGCTNERR